MKAYKKAPETMREVAERLVKDLKPYSVYIDYHAKTGSCYLKSKIKGVHQIRVGDHKGKGYKYKWEIGKHLKTQTNIGKYSRNLYNINDYDSFVKHFLSYYFKMFGI